MMSAEYVDFHCLSPGAVIEVQTKNRHYQIKCLGGDAIRISGHPEYCPDPVPAHLQGSTDKSGVLEPSRIGRGMYLKFVLDGRLPVTTSRVLSIHVNVPPESSATSHISLC